MAEEIVINNAEVGKRIRELREKHGLTQDALAEILSVGPNVVGCYERGEYGPSKQVMLRLGTYFGVSTDYLLYGETADFQDVMERIERFSDVDKMKVIVRLMYYFMKGKVWNTDNRNELAEMKSMFEQLFQAE